MQKIGTQEHSTVYADKYVGDQVFLLLFFRCIFGLVCYFCLILDIYWM